MSLETLLQRLGAAGLHVFIEVSREADGSIFYVFAVDPSHGMGIEGPPYCYNIGMGVTIRAAIADIQKSIDLSEYEVPA